MTPKQLRAEIKRLLSLLEDKHRRGFVLMYAPDPKNNPDVYDIVDSMEAKKLQWALKQCQNSYYTLFKVIKNA